MSPDVKPIPDYVLERWLLGELPAAEAEALRQRLAAEPLTQQRLEALRASNDDILTTHPPERVADEVRRRIAAAAADTAAPSANATSRASDAARSETSPAGGTVATPGDIRGKSVNRPGGTTMKIVCEQCGARYAVPDERVRGRGKIFRISCRRCGAPISVRGQEPEAAPAAEASKVEWFLVLDGERSGPLTQADVEAAVREGRAKPTTYGWCNGMDNWKKINEIEELSSLFPAPVAQPTLGSALEADAPEGDGPTVMQAVPSHEELGAEAAAAARSLFDSSDGPEEDAEPTLMDQAPVTNLGRGLGVGVAIADREAAASAQRAIETAALVGSPAALPRPEATVAPVADEAPAAAAGGDDLFSGVEGGDEGVVSSAGEGAGLAVSDGGAAQAQAGGGAGVHQRRESSVLFSLDAFTGGAKAPEAAAGPARPSLRESDLIDIREMARAQQDVRPTGDLFGDAGGVTALPDVAPMMLTQMPILRERSKTPWILLAAGLAVVTAGVLVYFLVFHNRGETPAAPAAGPAVATAPAAPEQPAAPGEPATAPAAQPDPAAPAGEPAAGAAQPATAPPSAAAPDAVAAAAAAPAAAPTAAGADAVAAAAAAPTSPGEAGTPVAAAATAATARKAPAAGTRPKTSRDDRSGDAPSAAAAPAAPAAPRSEPKPAGKPSSADDLLDQLARKNDPAAGGGAGGAGGAAGGAGKERLNPVEIKRVVGGAAGRVKNCYNATGPRQEGTVFIRTRITISGSGSVTDAAVVNAPFSGTATASCVVDALRAIKFPSFSGDSQTVNVPFKVQ